MNQNIFEYLAGKSENIDVTYFIINILLCAILSYILTIFYNYNFYTFSNKKNFSSIFIPISLITLVIITI